MNRWTYLRLALILLSVIAFCFAPIGPQAVPPIGWSALAAIFIFCPLGLLFVIGLQSFNSRSAKVWQRPSWRTNPFQSRDPLQFFHLAAHVSLSQGAVNVIRIFSSSTPFYVEALVPFAIGVGCLLGLRLIMTLFRSRISEA